MDAEQTQKQRDRQINLLLANSSAKERERIIAARKDQSLREAVLRLGGANDR
jgi:hypothetical protein